MNTAQGQAQVLQKPQPLPPTPGPDPSNSVSLTPGRTIISTKPSDRSKVQSPYEIYCMGTKAILMKQYPYLNSRELEHLVIRMWSQLSPQEKERYNTTNQVETSSSTTTVTPPAPVRVANSNNAVEFINKVGVKEETADKTENIFMRGDSDSEDDDEDETLNEQSSALETRSEEEIAVANIQPKVEPEVPAELEENEEDLDNPSSVEEEGEKADEKPEDNKIDSVNTKADSSENIQNADSEDEEEDDDDEENGDEDEEEVEGEEGEEDKENVAIDPLEENDTKTGEIIKSPNLNPEKSDIEEDSDEKTDAENDDERKKAPTPLPLKLPQNTVMYSNRSNDVEEDAEDPDDPDSLEEEEDAPEPKQENKSSRPPMSKRTVYPQALGPATVCYCLSNITENVIGCDTCPEWYHPECLGLSQHQMFDIHNVDTWRCPECLKISSKPPTPKNKVPPASIESPAKLTKLDKPPSTPAPVLVVPIAPTGRPNGSTSGPKSGNQGSKCNTCKVLVDEVKRRGETIEKLKAKIKFLESRKDEN